MSSKRKKITKYRIEKDTLGEVKVPASVYYGAQTARARDNFAISGRRFRPSFYRALALVKYHAAGVNASLGLLDKRRARAIQRAAREAAEGKFDADFVVDVFQTGSGTSSNMNANEIISNRAIEILKGRKGSKKPVHPNDHVNRGQSSNDVIPTAFHLAVLMDLRGQLYPALSKLEKSLSRKAKAFDDVVKLGRTHLQDAMPVRLGQEFSGYAAQVRKARQGIRRAAMPFHELALGGTAVGTGLNAYPGFAKRTIAALSKETKIPLKEAPNHFESLASRDAAVGLSGAFKMLACALAKIANDIRWMGCGPQGGLAEIRLPDLQPGSSIMPGKVNPVLCEVVVQVAGEVMGNDAAITFGGATGNFELNVMIPLMAYNLLESIHVLSRAMDLFAQRCVDGLKANKTRCRELAERSSALVTALVPYLGYDVSGKIGLEAGRTGRSVRALVRKRKLLGEKTLEKALRLRPMTEKSKKTKKH